MLNSKVTSNKLATVSTSQVNASGYFNWQQLSTQGRSNGGSVSGLIVILYFHCNSLPVCPCQPTQATDLELEVVPSHTAENVVCCILPSSRLAYPLGPGSFLTGQDLQDTVVCPSASTQQVRSPIAFSVTGGICIMIHGFGYDAQFTNKKIEGVALFS